MKMFASLPRKIAAALSAVVFSGVIAFAVTNQAIDGSLSVGGHYVTTGTIPVVSACGTSPSIATGSTDAAGKVTVGTSASAACTITFATAYGVAPSCIVQNATTGAPANVYAVSTTAITLSSVLADSTVLFYHCIALGS